MQPDPVFKPVVDTEAIFIRHLTLADTATIFRLSQEHGMKAWLPDQVYSDEAEAREVLRFLVAQYDAASPSKGPYVLGVCLSASHELIGHVGFSPCEYGVEVGFAIGEAYQNRGYAKQAVFAGTSWALSRFGLSSIHAIVAAANVGSCRVLHSCGFESVGLIQRRLHGVERTVRISRFTGVSRHMAGAQPS